MSNTRSKRSVSSKKVQDYPSKQWHILRGGSLDSNRDRILKGATVAVFWNINSLRGKSLSLSYRSCF